MKRIAICGGAGETGYWLAKKLADKFFVQVYDRQYSVRDESEKKPPAQQYNIFNLVDAPGYYANFRWNEFDACLQIAKPSMDAPPGTSLIESLKVNLHVLEACQQAGVRVVGTIIDPLMTAGGTIEALYKAYKIQYRMDTRVLWSMPRLTAETKAGLLIDLCDLLVDEQKAAV